MDGKIEQCVCIKFCVKLSKSATKNPWNALWGFWRTFFEPDSSFWLAFTFQGRSCQLKMTNVQGKQAPAKWQKMLKKIWELIHNNRRWIIHKLTDTAGISYGVCQILTENFNMRRTAAKFVHQLLTNDQKQRRVNLCLELREKANEDPAFISRIIRGDKSWICFPNWKWNWRDDVLKQCLTSKGNRKWHSTALRKMTSMVLFKHGKNYGVAVYIPKETIWRRMAAKIKKVKTAFLFRPSPGTFR
jgi:hypothetical protein